MNPGLRLLRSLTRGYLLPALRGSLTRTSALTFLFTSRIRDAASNKLAADLALRQPNGEQVYWSFKEAQVEADGTGKAKLWRYDEQVKDIVEVEIQTRDYGRSWSVVSVTAKPNNGLGPTANSVAFIRETPRLMS